MTLQLPFTMSKHAVERALEMNVDGVEIRACYDQPEDVLWSRKYACWWFVRGRITLSVSEDRACVITVLWSNEHDWRADYARGGDLTGRERRSRTTWHTCQGEGHELRSHRGPRQWRRPTVGGH